MRRTLHQRIARLEKLRPTEVNTEGARELFIERIKNIAQRLEGHIDPDEVPSMDEVKANIQELLASKKRLRDV